MKRTIAVLVLMLMLTVCAVGCAANGGDLIPGEKREPMEETLIGVLDDESQSFFETFSESSAEFMTVSLDQQYPVAIVTDKALMNAMVEALTVIRVTAKTNISSTDGYHSLGFVTAEGTSYSIGFENGALHEGGQNYIIENDGDFWELFGSIAADGWEQAQINAAQYESSPVSYAEEALAQSVSCELVSVNAEATDDRHWLDVCAVLRFTNESDSPITGIECKAQFLNYDGYIINEMPVTADFSDVPIAPGEAGEYTLSQRVFDFSSMCASVGGANGVLITVDSPMGDSADNIPSQGTPLFEFYNDTDIVAFAENFYDDPPAALTLRLDREDSFEDTVTDADTIAAVFEALKKISVGEGGQGCYTDHYTRLVFTYDDGREYVFSFNRYNLEIRDEASAEQNYLLYGSEELWTLIKDEYNR